MLTTELLNNNIPQLQLQDKVSKAIQLISDFRVTHLPVISAGRYIGLVSEDDLLDAKEGHLPIQILESSFVPASVSENDHFLMAVNCSNQFETTVVPVINAQGELAGVITVNDLLKALPLLCCKRYAITAVKKIANQYSDCLLKIQCTGTA